MSSLDQFYYFFLLGVFFIFLGVILMSLNSDLKIVKEKLEKLANVTEEKVNEIIKNSLKPLQDRAEEIAAFAGVDEDKTPPTPTVG